jgi:single-strand DNA-binding protein
MSVNKVILVGNVGKDPEVRHLDKDIAVAEFSLATTERAYTTKSGAQVPERTEWHNIVVRRDQVAFVEKWVKKGASVYVEGKIRTRTYDDQAGVKRYVTEIHADRVEFFSFGGKREEGQTDSAANKQASQPQMVQYAGTASPSPASSIPLETGESDDLPF